MWPWIHSAGWYRAMSRSRFEAKAGFKALPWNGGAMERGVGAWWVMTTAVVPSRSASASSSSMNARSSAWRRTESYVVNRPVPCSCRIQPSKSDMPSAARWAPGSCAMPSSRKVGPQRCADEVHVVDDDCVGVEQRNAEAVALLGELIAGAVDVGAVELVVPRDVEDVAGLGPFLGRVAHRACADRSKVSRAHDDVGAFGELRQRVVELEVEIGDNLNFHRAEWLRPDSVIERTTLPV